MKTTPMHIMTKLSKTTEKRKNLKWGDATEKTSGAACLKYWKKKKICNLEFYVHRTYLSKIGEKQSHFCSYRSQRNSLWAHLQGM